MTGRAAAVLERGGALAFGASSIGNLYSPVADERARAVVTACWSQGIRHFDTAPFYGFGLSERRLGDALRDHPRDNYILSTKVGRRLVPGAAGDKYGFVSPMPFDPVFDYGYDGVMRSFEASLHRLGLARVDILYLHDLGRVTHGDDDDRQFAAAMDGGYRALAELRAAGDVAVIGLGVNEVAVCERSFAHADFDLFMLAGRHTLLNHDASQFLTECDRRGVSIVAAGVFNSGILATGTGGADAPWYDYAPAPPEVIAQVRTIEAICTRHGVPLPAAAMQFAAAPAAVHATAIGTASPARIGDLRALANHVIPSRFWEELSAAGLVPAHVPLPNPGARP